MTKKEMYYKILIFAAICAMGICDLLLLLNKLGAL